MGHHNVVASKRRDLLVPRPGGKATGMLLGGELRIVAETAEVLVALKS